MAHSPKRITRKDLRRPDQFVTFTGKLIQLLKDHKTAAVVGAAGLFIVVVLAAGWDFYKTRQIRAAAVAYSEALTLFRDKKYREAIASFDGVSKYSLSTYSRLALLYEANSYLALNEPEKAIKPLEELLRKETKDSYLRQLALLTMGSVYEKAGKLQQASATYEKAEKTAGPFKEEALLGKARVSAENHDYKEALSFYRSYLTNYPTTGKSGDIELRIQELEAKVKDGGKQK